jgi:hypothetical protein
MDSKKFTPFGNNGKKGDRPIHHIAHWMQQWHNSKIVHFELTPRLSSKL